MNILPGKQFNIDEFRSPKSEYDVTYMWLWNVPVTRELVDRELSEYKKAGINSLYIVPLPKDFRPETIRTYLDPEYLTEEYLDIMEYAVRRAVELGMKPWLYDEGGWPSGGACGRTLRENPNAKLKYLEKREVSLSCDERFAPGEKFVALFDKKRRLPDDYIATRNVTLTAYYIVERCYDGNRVDYTNASVTETFLNNTYEKFKERLGDLFGDALPIIFTDEPGLMRDSIADDEFALFEERFGYDLRDYLYVIEDSGAMCETEAEIRARIDHGILLGELFKKNTFEKIAGWCEKNGIYYSGHLDIDNRPFGGMLKGTFSMVDALRHFHVPAVDVIWEQIRYPYGERGAVDSETLGFGFFPRLASSAARQRGRNVAATESLGIYGDGLTHDEIRFVTNYQFIRGINAVNYGSITLGKTRASCLISRPNFRPEKPGFYNMREVNEYYARLSYLARLGYAEGDTAIYMPCRDYFADQETLDLASSAFKAVGTALEAKNIPFDIIDDAGILEALDTGDGLKIGDAIYRHIAVPACRHMPDDVKTKIAPYLGEGAPSYNFKSDKLRLMTRRLDEGRLYFIFNEGEPTVTEEFCAEGKNVYKLDPRSGKTYRDSAPTFTLTSGDIAVYLVTEKEYETSECCVKYSVEPQNFKPISHRQFVIEYEGVKNLYGDGSIDVTPDFSGEITYLGKYELQSEPKAGEEYKITLDGFSSTVCVRLCDHEIPLGMSPMYATFDGAHLKKCGEIEITVANTAVNEIYAKMDLISSHPKAEVGAYQNRLDVTESRRPPLKFGKVKIERLI